MRSVELCRPANCCVDIESTMKIMTDLNEGLRKSFQPALAESTMNPMTTTEMILRAQQNMQRSAQLALLLTVHMTVQRTLTLLRAVRANIDFRTRVVKSELQKSRQCLFVYLLGVRELNIKWSTSQKLSISFDINRNQKNVSRVYFQFVVSCGVTLRRCSSTDHRLSNIHARWSRTWRPPEYLLV